MPRIRLTFAWRLALTSLLVTALGMMLLAAALVVLVESYESQRRSQELLSTVEVEAAYLSELASLSGLQAAAAVVVERFAASSLRAGDQVVRIFGRRGELIASSSPAPGYFPSGAAAVYLSTPLPALADETNRRYAAQPVIVAGQTIAVIELSHSREDERQLLALITRLLIQATLLALLLALAGSAILGRLAARQVERLRRVAEGIAGGDLDLRAPDDGPYELAQLAHSLNSMADQLQDRLHQLQAAAEREGRFYRDVAHELRTPLTGLRGYLEQIEDTATGEQQAVVESLKSELGRLSRLAGQLSRPDGPRQLPLARVAVDLVGLIQDICAALAGRAERAGLALLPLVEGAPALVQGDRDRLKQALLNLLDNALRHTPPGGTVQVVVRPAEDSRRTAVEVLVRDTGPGVPPPLRDQIWRRGVRGPDGGSGLGLAIVREIVEAHAGEARLLPSESGSTFSLVLPTFTSVHRPVTGEQ